MFKDLNSYSNCSTFLVLQRVNPNWQSCLILKGRGEKQESISTQAEPGRVRPLWWLNTEEVFLFVLLCFVFAGNYVVRDEVSVTLFRVPFQFSPSQSCCRGDIPKSPDIP